MERLLHYAWKCHILPLRELRTTDGRALEVIDSGQNNQDAGPDFFNAKVRIDGTVWAGNVEIHLRSSDWFRHGHHEDEAYDNVVLHVTENADVDVVNSKGKTIPQVVIPIPDSLRHNYEELLTTMDYPRCHKMIPEMPMMMVHSWMDALLCERLQERSGTQFRFLAQWRCFRAVGTQPAAVGVWQAPRRSVPDRKHLHRSGRSARQGRRRGYEE